ncbi:MAG: DUF4135 domain-containing protein [Lachnospiraceae bacterium]
MQNRMEQAYAKIKSHKRAILYTFFDILEDLELQTVTPIGQTRSCVQFAQNKRVIYDERLLYTEQTFQKYLAWFNQNVQKDLPFYRKKILVYDDCSFVEFLEEQSCGADTDSAFYQRLGSLAALVAAIGGKELHRQEIIRMEEHPVIRDVWPLFENGYQYCPNIAKEPVFLQDFLQEEKQAGWIKDGYQKSVLFCKENSADVEELLKIYHPWNGGAYAKNI